MQPHACQWIVSWWIMPVLSMNSVAMVRNFSKQCWDEQCILNFWVILIS